MTEQTTRVNLEALEQRAEKALEKTETGWREFAEAMREIKQSEAHRDAGYKYFRPYYRERWEVRTGKSFFVMRETVEALDVVESIESVEPGSTPPADYATAGILRKIPDDEGRAKVWREHVESGAPTGGASGGREILRNRVREHVGEGVIEQAEERGIVVPPEPRGKTPSEAAWLAMAEASRLIRGVEPADAARVEKGRTAARYQEQMWELAEWTRLFAHELAAYVEETHSAGTAHVKPQRR